MPKVDYVWVIVGVLALLLLVLWKPLTSWFRDFRYKATNQEQYERGKAVFYDDEIWAGAGAHKACATCHAADYNVPEGAAIEMEEYRPGKPYPLKDIAKKYGSNMLSTEDALYDQIMICLSSPARMGCGRVSRNAKHLQDLLVYVRRQ